MTKQEKIIDISCILLIFFVGTSVMLRLNWNTFQSLYWQTPDGDLYLSIAKNFWNSGHFIQNARPHEINMIVPFGLPLIYTIIWGIFRSIVPIIAVQYIVFGLSGILLYKIIEYLSGYRLLALLGALSFYYIDNVQKNVNPSSLLTETWIVFLSVLFVFSLLLTREKMVFRMIVSFILYVIRPVCIPFLIISILEIGVCIYKKGISHNKKSIICGLIFCLILGGNTYVNYRETGDFVLLQNYAGIAFYQANNPNTKLDDYNSARAYEFVDENDKFWDIYNGNYTTYEKSAKWTEMAKEYIANNRIKVIQNTRDKFVYMFISYYMPYCLIASLFWIYYCVYINRKVGLLIVIPYIIIAILTSFGLVIDRYSIFIIPLFVLGCWSLMGTILKCCQSNLKKG